MRAAYYERQGPAQEVFRVGELSAPEPGPGEVRVKLRTSGVNPSDWKVRKGGFGRGLVAPLIVPHSDGAGVVDAVGSDVTASRIGERVWIWNGQWKRAFGTAAEYIALPKGRRLFMQWTAGRAANEQIFLRADGNPWGASHQQRPLAEAAKRAKLTP